MIKIYRLLTNKYSQEYLLEAFSSREAMLNNNVFNVIAYLETAKSHVFLLLKSSYPYIVWNNVPKFQENRASSF